MQHIVHIFIDAEPDSFRDRFASIFRELHPDIESSLFSAIQLTLDDTGAMSLSPDENGDIQDATTISSENIQAGLINYFESMYSRKVTVAHPGNRSLVAVIWTKLYTCGHIDTVTKVVDAINHCSSNITVEISGFTNRAVSCFIPDPNDRHSPDEYKECFDKNIATLRTMRQSLAALRLIANCNMQNVSLNFDFESMGRVCAEYSAIMCENYLTIHKTIIDAQQEFESFGLSAIKFDKKYYHDYIRNRIIIDKMRQQNIDNRRFSINALAQKTNPILQTTIDDIKKFYDTEVANAKAQLALSHEATPANIVGDIDPKLRDIVKELRKNIGGLVESDKISAFECEAIISLILGDDCEMFDTSAVQAKEIVIDDIIDNSARFFINLDSNKTMLQDVSQQEISEIRTKMRNIAIANRQREDRINALSGNRKQAQAIASHINGNEYQFGGIGYRLDLNIDTEPLEITYQPHAVNVTSIDMRERFAPIRNQGHQGSCSAFATTAVIEFLRSDKQRYSPAFLYWNARVLCGDTAVDSGATMYQSIKAATEKGVCQELQMPYDPDTFTTAPSEAAIEDALNCKVLEAQTVNTDLNSIKSALCDGYPVIIAARIFDSFSETNCGFVPHPSAAEIAGKERSDGNGLHAMVICGFSDKERVFVVRNSWGTNFGENGYCYIPYSYATKYILQACIITQVTAANGIGNGGNTTLNFNMSDSNIETAILKNLIAEDNYELAELAEKSNKLKMAWTQNIGLLGNVNNQADLINEAKEEISKCIQQEEATTNNLQSTKSDKQKDFSRKYIKRIVISGLFVLVAWLVTYFTWYNTPATSIATVLSLIFIIICSKYGWENKNYRQQLINEIQQHANNIDRLKATKNYLEIDAHVHGMMLKEVGDYKVWLQGQKDKLHAFNADMVSLYDTSSSELAEMTPTVPYPFLTVLNNKQLDIYYDTWKKKMTDAIDFKQTLSSYNIDDNLADTLSHNETLENAIMRGLNGFSMLEYITRSNPAKWQFLPKSADMNVVFPDLDSRANPFFPLNQQQFTPVEKFLFIKGITAKDMLGITQYFTQQPMPIAVSDPYSITILNTIRYELNN
jgi:hypothetical protein